jgi:stage II sporulation protein R
MNRWKKLECSLLVGLAVMLLLGGRVHGAQTALAEKLVRLHVIANSDSEGDQAVKLLVRDRMLKEVETLLAGEKDLNQAKEKIKNALPRLAAAGQEVVEEEHMPYQVTAALEQTFFPTKEYEGFSLPAGEYTALRIVLGEGRGANWWCVLFPPLCTGVASEQVAETAQAAGLTQEEIGLITEQDSGYVVRFRCVELWERFCHLFS